MSRMRLAVTAVMATCGLMLVGGTSAANAQDVSRLTQVVPMSGTVTKGGQKGKQFTGTYTIQRFVTSGGKLYSVGTLKGKAGKKKVSKENVRVPAAVANNAAVRRGLPPSVTVTLHPTDHLVLHTVQLPIRGHPSLYPFETWRLWLGLTLTDVRPDGARVPLTIEQLPSHATFTLQSLLPDVLMAPPMPIAPQQVAAVHDPPPEISFGRNP